MTRKSSVIMRFDGEGYIHERDGKRLTDSYYRLFEFMSDGRWRYLSEMSRATYTPEASCSASIRSMRKKRFGTHTLEREYVEHGLHQYRLIVNSTPTV